ncbi:MAG: winged helix-turn-helix transcriptional regulator [Planctomycetes bacterium]|nr:winged helix-turn-helix transcriptional regulator [Planctomycetota bacterium]MBL7042365.1 winged helix-turn-helix transcriptional regulator [Pirellulaceae bacterium]
MISRLSSSVTPEKRDEVSRRPTGGVVKDLAQLFKLLADETRLRILDMLGARKELCVRDLWERLGQSQPAVSHHLGLLRMAGLVDTRHEGKHIYYRIHQERFDEMMGMMQQTQVGERLLHNGGDSETPQEMPTADSASTE